MESASFSNLTARSISISISLRSLNHRHHQQRLSTSNPRRVNCSFFTPILRLTSSLRRQFRRTFPLSSGNGGGFYAGEGGGGGGGDGDGDSDGEDDYDLNRNRNDAIIVLAEVGRTFGSLPEDLVAAIEAGRLPGSMVERFLELEKSPILRWLLNFGGYRERLLADDLFLVKVAIEIGIGIFVKTVAELERRREKFRKELDFVFADVVMATVANFMLVWLPAPTISLRSPPALGAGPVAKFFYGCPNNAFQVALAGTSYSLLERTDAIVCNGAKLFVVGTGASLIGVGVTNGLIHLRKALDKPFAGKAEDVQLSTSVASGIYMAVSSNLRYQVLAGVIEQRILVPLLHQHKLALGAASFALRTGNTFLGSLMWADYARWVGIRNKDLPGLPFTPFVFAVNFSKFIS